MTPDTSSFYISSTREKKNSISLSLQILHTKEDIPFNFLLPRSVQSVEFSSQWENRKCATVTRGGLKGEKSLWKVNEPASCFPSIFFVLIVMARKLRELLLNVCLQSGENRYSCFCSITMSSLGGWKNDDCQPLLLPSLLLNLVSTFQFEIMEQRKILFLK